MHPNRGSVQLTLDPNHCEPGLYRLMGGGGPLIHAGVQTRSQLPWVNSKQDEMLLGFPDSICPRAEQSEAQCNQTGHQS